MILRKNVSWRSKRYRPQNLSPNPEVFWIQALDSAARHGSGLFAASGRPLSLITNAVSTKTETTNRSVPNYARPTKALLARINTPSQVDGKVTPEDQLERPVSQARQHKAIASSRDNRSSGRTTTISGQRRFPKARKELGRSAAADRPISERQIESNRKRAASRIRVLGLGKAILLVYSDINEFVLNLRNP